MDERRPVYTFAPARLESAPATGSVQRSTVHRESKGNSIRRIAVFFVGLAVVVLVAIVVSHLNPDPSRSSRTAAVAPAPRSAPLSWSAALVGSRPVACPPQFRSNRGTGFERCLAVDLPGSGEWVRRVSTSDAWEMPLTPNVQARGCGGEVYSLGSGGNRINESCGYLDYRVTDARPRTIIEGHNPVAPQQARPTSQPSDWGKGFDYGRAGGEDISCVAPAGITNPADWGAGCQSGRHATGQEAAQPISPAKGGASNASFDCAKAGTPVELVICAHPDLISLDAELGQVYETKLATLQGENRKRFTEEQRHWIITRNAACGIPTRGTPGPAFISEKKPCLLSHIRSRIEAIRKT